MKKTIYYKTAEEIELIRQSCLLVCKTLSHVASILRPGITGKVIDREAEMLIRDHGAIPAFKGYRGFPATLCVSVNEVVVHGIPNDAQVFKSGDVVSVDCGVQMNGFFGDAAYTFALGEVPEETMALLRATHDSLYKGIEQVAVGNRLGDLSFAIQDFIERKHGYAVVRELVGHGLGRSLHEAPDVPNFGKRGKGPLLMEGLVIAIEPMVNLGKRDVRTKRDGWTVYAKDMRPSAHYEHSVAVRKSGVDILSNHEPIVAEIRKNTNIKELFPEAVLT
jgi:methionyl aminopeptidase